MKRNINIIIAGIIMIILTACNQKNNNSNGNDNEPINKISKVDGNGPQIVFDKTKIIIDTLNAEEVGKCTFRYTNIGDQPLILSNVITTCGCVQSNYSDKPLMPGLTDSISFELRIKELGQFTKAVVVKSNAINESAVTLRMFGYMKEREQQKKLKTLTVKVKQ